MATNGGGAALAKLIGKNIRQLDAEMGALGKHMKFLQGFAANPVAHQISMKKMSVDAVKRITKAQDQSDKLWFALRKATEKMPSDERKRSRKELEKALKKTDDKIASAGKAAEGLYRKLEQIQKDKIIDSPAEGALQMVLVTLQALITARKGWKKMRERTLK